MKVSRHAKIVELINQYNIETQEELAEQLNKAGFQVTQATVSRDIRDLRLTKVAGENGKQKYVILQVPEKDMKEKYMRILKDGYVSMEMAQNILVVKTVSGMAMAVADISTSCAGLLPFAAASRVSCSVLPSHARTWPT